jgi:outer membrane lipase/esterase
MKFHRIQASLLALATAAFLAACGGSGETASTTPKVNIRSVKVFGDSLQDSGTFGFKFTVQSPDSLLYVERIAAQYGQTLCNFYVFTGVTFAPNPRAGCTNFAIGGGRVNYTGPGASPANPLNVPTQLATYASLGSYNANDLVIVDGGGNDAADLVGSYLAAAGDRGASFAALLSTLLPTSQVNALLAAGPSGFPTAGGAYMQALADRYYDSVKVNVLDKGAQYVVLMNLPAITNTPRFQLVLDGIAASGAGATGRAQSEALFRGWVAAFNSRLAARVGAEPRIALIDFAKSFDDQVAMPAQFGLTNVKTPACPATGRGADGLPEYTFPTCTAAALSAAPPAGQTGPDWWKTYAFSDGFHPTPYGHQATSQLIATAMSKKGWL